ncbi:uncharacterized protein IWZ02DRAFT_83108 [Phyllosticta citriasiana]|uniref:Uncharacterized protein n=1 Tax=Phyllosticta citriasiana TaxID=595635 RepID=A0ABR1KL57_9PEZI
MTTPVSFQLPTSRASSPSAVCSPPNSCPLRSNKTSAFRPRALSDRLPCRAFSAFSSCSRSCSSVFRRRLRARSIKHPRRTKPGVSRLCFSPPTSSFDSFSRPGLPLLEELFRSRRELLFRRLFLPFARIWVAPATVSPLKRPRPTFHSPSIDSPKHAAQSPNQTPSFQLPLSSLQTVKHPFAITYRFSLGCLETRLIRQHVANH